MFIRIVTPRGIQYILPVFNNSRIQLNISIISKEILTLRRTLIQGFVAVTWKQSEHNWRDSSARTTLKPFSKGKYNKSAIRYIYRSCQQLYKLCFPRKHLLYSGELYFAFTQAKLGSFSPYCQQTKLKLVVFISLKLSCQ